MTTLAPPPEDVLEASPEELRRAVRKLIKQSGFTYRELAEQASTGRFETVAARKAWVVLGGMSQYLPAG